MECVDRPRSLRSASRSVAWHCLARAGHHRLGLTPSAVVASDRFLATATKWVAIDMLERRAPYLPYHVSARGLVSWAHRVAHCSPSSIQVKGSGITALHPPSSVMQDCPI